MQRLLRNHGISSKKRYFNHLLHRKQEFITKNEVISALSSFKLDVVNRFYSTPDSRIKEDWQLESQLLVWKRNAILIKGKMTEQRHVTVPIPKFITTLFHSLKQKFTGSPTAPSSNSHFYTQSSNDYLHKRSMSFQLYSILRSIKINYKIIEDKENQRKNIVIPYTISNLAGHGSFLCLALSYLESDFLHLRMYAFTGISLAMFFQYYREKPLWIPIRWNSLFLLINLVMIITLLKDENDASNLTEEEKLLYKAVFEKRGMKPVDYLHLISMSKRLEFHKHDKLVDEKKKNNRVYLVKKGKLSVLKNGVAVGSISQHQFVGAMSFLTWEGALETSEKVHLTPTTENNTTRKRDYDNIGPITSMLLDIVADDAIPDDDSQNLPVHHYKPPVSEIIETTLHPIPPVNPRPDQCDVDLEAPLHWIQRIPLLSKEFADKMKDIFIPSTLTNYPPLESNSSSNSTPSSTDSVTVDSHGKTVNNAEEVIATADAPSSENKGFSLAGAWDNITNYSSSVWHYAVSYVPYLGKESEELSIEAMEENSPISSSPSEVVNVVAATTTATNLEDEKDSNSNQNPKDDGHLGVADVVCEEDCIVYSWKFKDLHQLISHNPKLGLVFERCLSEDFNKKMSTSWEEEIKSRYKQILLGALMDGEVNEVEKKVLSKFRAEYHITADDHERILREFDWNLDDYDRGYKGGANDGVIEDYTNLLTKELESPDGLSDDGRRSLRSFRMKHEISSETHLNILKRLGWTMDEYEIGSKTDVENKIDKSIHDAVTNPATKVKNSHSAATTRVMEVIRNRPVISFIRRQLENHRHPSHNQSQMEQAGDNHQDIIVVELDTGKVVQQQQQQDPQQQHLLENEKKEEDNNKNNNVLIIEESDEDEGIETVN